MKSYQKQRHCAHTVCRRSRCDSLCPEPDEVLAACISCWFIVTHDMSVTSKREGMCFHSNPAMAEVERGSSETMDGAGMDSDGRRSNGIRFDARC